MSTREKVIIFPADGSEPPTGFFSVTLKRGCVNRALMIEKENDIWRVFLDGAPIENGATQWAEAFGALYNLPMLMGRQLSRDEYQDLLRRRIRDQFSGIDMNKPLNLNEVRIK